MIYTLGASRVPYGSMAEAVARRWGGNFQKNGRAGDREKTWRHVIESVQKTNYEIGER